MRIVRLILLLAVIGPAHVLGQALFIDATQSTGIDHYQRSELHIGGGVAIFDLDNDGWEDIYLTGGEDRDKLYRNNGDGTFTEVGVDAGFGFTAAVTTFGVTTGDVDNDGFRDVLILTEMPNANMLFLNNGDGTFTRSVTAFDFFTGQRSVSASFGDVNGDGFLDIYITNYVDVANVLFEGPTPVGFNHTCFSDQLLVNNGDGSFTDATAFYGIDQQGCGLATAFTDFDLDGHIDIMVVNDFGQWVIPNALYRNLLPDQFFEDMAPETGMDGGFYGMGVAIGDYDRDGDLDYYMTNIGANFLYRNDGGLFTELAETAGVINDSVNGLNTTGWGCFFFDADNDGWQDLFVANGEIPAAQFIANSLEDPDKLFRNNGDGTFTDITWNAGIGSLHRSRGAAFGDLNNDGHLDVVVNGVRRLTSEPATAKVYFNVSENGNNWLKVKAEGVHSNRDAFGSIIRIVVEGQSQVLEVSGGSSHASHNSSIAHFGLGSATAVDSVIVRFPSGTERSLTDVGANQVIHVVEDDIVTRVHSLDNTFLQRVGFRDFEVIGGGFRTGELRVLDMAGRMLHRESVSSRFSVPEELKGLLVIELVWDSGALRERGVFQ